ncbi:MAG: hypothetical protein R2849_19615 [Thermomicrobiales bacterium]
MSALHPGDDPTVLIADLDRISPDTHGEILWPGDVDRRSVLDLVAGNLEATAVQLKLANQIGVIGVTTVGLSDEVDLPTRGPPVSILRPSVHGCRRQARAFRRARSR